MPLPPLSPQEDFSACATLEELSALSRSRLIEIVMRQERDCTRLTRALGMTRACAHPPPSQCSNLACTSCGIFRLTDEALGATPRIVRALETYGDQRVTVTIERVRST